MLDIVASYYCIQFQTSEKGKKKKLVLGPFGPKSGCRYFFFKNLAPLVTRCHGQLSSCTISEKTKDLILTKLTEGRTDGQTGMSDFIAHCPTNVMRPLWKK